MQVLFFSTEYFHRPSVLNTTKAGWISALVAGLTCSLYNRTSVILLRPQISSASKSVLRQLCVHSLWMLTDPRWSNSVKTSLPLHRSLCTQSVSIGETVGARNDVSSKVITQMDIAGPRRGTNTCKTVVTTSIDRFYFTGKEFVDEANVQLVDDIGSKSDAFVLQDNYGVEFVNSAWNRSETWVAKTKNCRRPNEIRVCLRTQVGIAWLPGKIAWPNTWRESSRDYAPTRNRNQGHSTGEMLHTLHVGTLPIYANKCFWTEMRLYLFVFLFGVNLPKCHNTSVQTKLIIDVCKLCIVLLFVCFWFFLYTLPCEIVNEISSVTSSSTRVTCTLTFMTVGRSTKNNGPVR